MALNHSVTGSVSYTIVGSPTIVDGVASGFSTSDYLATSQNITTSDVTSLEAVIKYNTSSTGTNMLLRIGTSSTYAYQLRTITGGNIAYTTPDTTYVSNAHIADYHYVKLTTSGGMGSNVNIQVSNDGVTWVQPTLTTASNSQTAHDGPFVLGRTLDGSMDLNATYIKINGQAWFGVCPIEVKHIDYGTSVGYTKVGSPTISNGVVSDLSANDYVQTDAVFPYTENMALEVQVKYDVTELGRIFRLGTGSQTAFNIRNHNAYIAFYALDTAYISNLVAADYKYLRVNVPNLSQNNVTIQASNDGRNWTTGTISTAAVSQTAPGSNVHAVFGRGNVVGSVDLSGTYIKINGKLWVFRPVTNYLIKDDKLIWCAQDLYLNDSGTITLASQDTAPVPSGFTYGSTTTTDVGLVDIPTQAFTAHPGATIGKGTPPSGPDANTIVLLHFNDNMDDSSTYSQTLSKDQITDTYMTGKFGKALNTLGYVSQSTLKWRDGGADIPVTNGFTYEYWKYVDPNKWYSYSTCPFVQNSGITNIWYLNLQDKNLAYQCGPFSGAVAYSAISAYLVENDWNHFAVSFNPNDAIRIFVNGHVVSTINTAGWMDPANWAGYLASKVTFKLTGNSPLWAGIDEFRMSDTCRYTADFTPPTSPF